MDKANLQILGSTGLMLQLDAEGSVLVPMDENERALCRRALNSAIALLAETVVTWNISSMEVGIGAAPQQSSPHLVDFRERAGLTLPSEQPEGAQAGKLRLVSHRQTETET